MKKILVLFLLSVCFSVPAFADHHLIYISKVAKISDTECAVEMTLYGDNQDAYENDDVLRLDNVDLVNFTDIVDAGIDEAAGNNDTGDTILAASPDFEANQDIDADLSFANSSCVNFDSNANFGIVIVGFGAVDSLDTSDVNTFGGDNTAITRTEANDTSPDDLDLDQATLTITNNSAVDVTLGTSGETGDGPHFNCALGAAAPSRHGLLLLLGGFFAHLLIISFFRIYPPAKSQGFGSLKLLRK